MRLKQTFVAVMFAVLAMACGPAPKKELVIAAVAPMTGKWSEMGNDLLAAVKMAVEERNATGGIDGMQVRLVLEDDKASPKDGVSVAHKIVGDQSILGVVGHMNSGTTLPASSVYAEAGMAVVMPVPTNPEITKQGLRNLFRVPVTDDKQGPAIVTFAVEKLGKKKVAVIYSKDAYGEGIATEAKKSLESRGLAPVVFEGINSDDQDFRAVITRLKVLEPDAVFFGSGYSEAAIFIKQARELGLSVPFVMGDGCYDSQLMQIAGAAADGSYISNISPTSAPDERAKAFFETFLARNGKIVAWAPLGYVSAQILLDAIDRAEVKTRDGVLKVLQDPAYSFDSILGKFSFEANGDSRNQRVFMHVIEGGQFKTLKD